jgi:cyclopropane fatty-acyl-phospholipid synthase-like methyltransferase
MAQSIVTELAPGSAVDFGCGSGALLVDLRRLGVAVRGFDYSEAALTLCRRQNLDVGKFDLESSQEIDCPPADIVISTEVAEHLPESCADRYVDVLCSKANTVIFTAATPGQGGHDHVNEQPHQYWLDKFAARGFRLDHPATFRWRAEWEAKGVALWYHRNLMILRREV